MTDASIEKPFNGWLTPTPYRIPNLLLWGSGVLVGFATLAIAYFTHSIASGLLPMMILMFGSALVSGCALLAYKQQGGLFTLYFGAITLILISGWITFDDYRTQANTRAAESQLAADLTALCRSSGGAVLADAACAEQLRVLDNYYSAKRDEPASARTP